MEPLKIGDLTIKLPIIQGGMGVSVSLAGLASAVANQGGVGVISSVGIGLNYATKKEFTRKGSIDGFRKEIRKAREMSPVGVLGANIMMALTDFEKLFKVAIEEELDIVFIGAGLFVKIPEGISHDEFVNSKTKLVPKLSSARAVKLVLKVWDDRYNRLPDAIVLEGAEAGGHLGFKKSELEKGVKSIYEIVEETREIMKPYEEKYGIKLPIIAGGGIYTGEDIQKVFESGADGVKMGTRFVTTHECDADIKFKEQYLNAKKEDIVIIDSPVGLPGRAIINDFIRSVRAGEQKPIKCPWKCLVTCNYKEVPYCIADALYKAAQGDLDEGFAFAGSNAYKATKINSVADVFSELKQEYNEAVLKKKVDELTPVLN